MHNELKKMMDAKFHTTSYHVWSPRASRRGVLGTPKFNFLQNWPNFQGRLDLTWRSFFAYMIFFCAILSYWDVVSFSNFKVFSLLRFFPKFFRSFFFLQKIMLISKDSQYLFFNFFSLSKKVTISQKLWIAQEISFM